MIKPLAFTLATELAEDDHDTAAETTFPVASRPTAVATAVCPGWIVPGDTETVIDASTGVGTVAPESGPLPHAMALMITSATTHGRRTPRRIILVHHDGCARRQGSSAPKLESQVARALRRELEVVRLSHADGLSR